MVIIEFQKKKEMGKRPRKTPAEKARAQYTNYAVKEPMELMEFLAAKMPDASRTKLKSLLSKRVVFVDNVITTQFNFPLEAGMKVQISKQKGKKEFNNRLLKIVYEDAYIIVVEKMQGLLSVNTERQKERTAYTILNEYVQRSGRQFRVFIVHRLDRDTSGLMMFAKDEKTQRTLRDNWHDIVTDRRYVAVVEGSMEKDYDTVVSWLTDKTLYVSSSEYDDGGSKSITHYKTIKRANGYSLLELDLETGRKKIITNPEGNNLDTGICSLLLNHCDMRGRVHADYLVLETDESHVPVVYSKLNLQTLVLLNFFRDQLDRNGEVETLILKVKKFLETFEGNVVLNADDPNVARLGLANPNNKNIHYFSVDRYQGATDKPYEVGEGKFCPFCDTELVYDYYQYSHIGKFHCPKCGFGNIEPEVEIKNVDLTVPSFEADGETYKTAHNSIYYMYNMAAVYTAAKLYNFDKAILHDTFEHFEVNNGRLERFEVDGSSLLVNLAKNPVGANMTLRVMNEQAGSKELLFVLNDNLADGHDVSWIWDINFSVFNNVDRVVTSGTRAYDIAIRIKCSGYDPDKIFVYPDLDEATASLFSTKGDKFAIANYTAIQPTRAAIKRYKSLKENGEEK